MARINWTVESLKSFSHRALLKMSVCAISNHGLADDSIRLAQHFGHKRAVY